MALPARLEDGDLQVERREKRRTLKLQVPGNTNSHAGIPVLIHDISSFGILIETRAALTTGTILDIEFPQVGEQAATVVWNRGEYFGCEFQIPLSKAGLGAALLKGYTGQGYVGSFDSLGSDLHEPTADTLPIRTRVVSILALALASWIVCIALYFFLKS